MKMDFNLQIVYWAHSLKTLRLTYILQLINWAHIALKHEDGPISFLLKEIGIFFNGDGFIAFKLGL